MDRPCCSVRREKVSPPGESWARRWWEGVALFWTAGNKQLYTINLLTFQSAQVIPVCLTATILAEKDNSLTNAWWIVSRPIKVFKTKNFEVFFDSECVCTLVFMRVDPCKCVRKGVGGVGVFLAFTRAGAYSSLSYPAVVQSGDLADPCVSAHLSPQAVIVM